MQLVPRGQKEHRAGDPPCPQRLAHVTPVGIGQPDVEDDGVEGPHWLPLHGRQGPGPVAGGHHGQPVIAQAAGHELAELVIVLDDEDTGAAVDSHAAMMTARPSIAPDRSDAFRSCAGSRRDATAMDTTRAPSETARALLNKVPEVTIWFWVIKILATTVGETAADYLNVTLGFGLTGTTVVVGAIFVVMLGFQFRARRYVPPLYWATVVLISVVGTLITDNLTDNLGVPLEVTTAVFAVALAVAFAAWYSVEKTLSIHSIVTRRREAFYWLAILLTFALGTAAGDLVAERLGVGFWLSALLFAAVIGAVAASHLVFKANAVLAFWIAYVLTRPLGASLGDGFSQPTADGGVGLGTTLTSAAFLVAILAVVSYLALSKRDQLPPVTVEDLAVESSRPR